MTDLSDSDRSGKRPGGVSVLWIAGDVPIRPINGLQRYSSGLSHAVAPHCSTFVGIGLRAADALRDSPVAPSPTGEDAFWIEVGGQRRGWLRGLFSPMPNLTSACATHQMTKELRHQLDARQWDLIVIDHLQSAWCWRMVKRWRRGRSRAPQVVFVTHNFESGTRREIAAGSTRGFVARTVLRFDAWKAARVERDLVRGADLVTAITEDDAHMLETVRRKNDVAVLVPGYDGATRERPITQDLPRRVVVLGSFDWHVKQDNLRRHLAASDAMFAAAGIEQVIIGKMPSDFRRSLEPTLRATRIEGFVDDPSEILSTCRIGIISEPSGGGFKMKTLDYIFNSIVLAHLNGSVAGLPLDLGRHTLMADTEADLSSRIVESIDDIDRLETMRRESLVRCRQTFAWSERAAQLLSALPADGRSGLA